jgi:hypothetical protein
MLPDARKKYIARPQKLPYLTVGEVAAKAGLYGENIDTEEMLRYVNSYFNLCAYLVADGYGITNPLFRTRISIPGEYDGNEAALPEGLHPAARINIAPAFQSYISEHVKLDFKGIDETEGHMFTFLDEASGTDTRLTPAGLLRVRGTSLKILHDGTPEHIAAVGLWFVLVADPTVRVRATAVAINEPRTIVAVVPPSLGAGLVYSLEIITQSSVKNSEYILRDTRAIRSEHHFTVAS